MRFWDIIDFIPVAGTIKNAGECVVCICKGDARGAVSNGAQALVGGVLDVVTLGAASTVTKAAFKGILKASGKLGAKQVAKQVVVRAVTGNVCVRALYGLGKAPRQSYRRSRTTSENNGYFSNTPSTEVSWQEICQRKNEREKPEKPGKEKKPSRRGEHIINNSVLNIYRDIVRRFVQDVLGEDWEELEDMLSEDSSVLQNMRDPLPPSIRELISRELVVHLQQSYIDNNAEAYGRMVKKLRDAAFAYMERLYHLPETPRLIEMEIYLCQVVEDFIAGGYFVDEYALSVWIKREGSRDRFEEARREVESMLRALVPHMGNNMLADWVRELKKAAEKLKKQRSELRKNRKN